MVARIARDIQAKCDDCIPRKMSGKNNEPRIPITESKYLPAVEKPKTQIHLVYIGQISHRHR